MKSTVQTRIFLSLTPDEARAAVANAVDMQLCIRQALYEVDGTPVADLVTQNSKHKLAALAAPSNRRKAKTATASPVECPQCHKLFNPNGLGIHIARTHPRPVADVEQRND